MDFPNDLHAFVFAPYIPFSTDTRVVVLTCIMLLFCLKPSRGCPHSLRVESKVLEWPLMPWRSSSIPSQTSSPFSPCWLPELWPQGLLVLGGTVPPMSQVQACGSMFAVPSAWSIPPHSACLPLLLQAYAEMSPFFHISYVIPDHSCKGPLGLHLSSSPCLIFLPCSYYHHIYLLG